MAADLDVLPRSGVPDRIEAATRDEWTRGLVQGTSDLRTQFVRAPAELPDQRRKFAISSTALLLAGWMVHPNPLTTEALITAAATLMRVGATDDHCSVR